ncbi:MAG: LLM class flavin-dependent oxidoreductase, partial [Gammaproteobacteria bacterium]|nr:LLM class flavin-dependent oxidoreductase [Gammaproteobacteria bacterium]
MKVDFYAPPGGVHETARLAESAASAGFDGFFVSETSHDPFVLLAAASQAVGGSLDFGTAVAVAFPRSPMVTAMASWDLARESKFILGLGTQVSAHIRGRFSMEWGAPVERLRDYVEALRAIWSAWQSGGKLNHRGEFYRFTLMTPFFDPGPIPDPVIPVWLAGVGPRSTRLAGEIADGFHIHPFHTVRYLDEVVTPGLAEGWKAAARDPGAVAVSASVLAATGRNAAEVA